MTGTDSGYPLVVAGFTVIATALLLGVPSLLGTVGQLALGIPLVLVFPGYVVVTLLFRSSGRQHRFTGGETSRFGVEQWNGVVTLGISVGFSIVVVAVLARVVMATWGYSRESVVISLAAFVFVGSVIGAYRSGYSLDTGVTSAGATLAKTRGYLANQTKFGLVTTVILVVSVVFFLSTVTFALSGTPDGESYTEFYILTENESGELVASDYPTTLRGSDGTELVAGIENHENENTTYTFVVELQSLQNDSVIVERELYRTRRMVESGERALIPHSIETQMRGENLRLQYYLYRGTAPADASTDDAYRTVHLNVSSAGG